MIRAVTKADAPRLIEIYSYYVKNTLISAEYEVPTVEEFERRIESTTKKFPYFCIEEDGRILGYAYANPFHWREAFKYDAELSIYLDKSVRKHGYDRLLYEALEKELKQMGIINLYSCISVPDGDDDEFLTHNSERFHEHLGFTKIGTFRGCKKKFDRWFGMVWMEKTIGERN